jgi:IS5 family transposase
VLTRRRCLGGPLAGAPIVDATLIAASPSTKNEAGKRDPQMPSSKKGNQWYFGMKAHVGVDASSGLVHTAGVTSGNLHDAKVMDRLVFTLVRARQVCPLECRLRAAECQKLAECQTNPRVQAILGDMAGTWTRLAVRAEQPSRPNLAAHRPQSS